MPQITDYWWKERVKSIKAENPSWGAGRITAALEKEAEEHSRTEPPSERTVGRVLRDDWGKMKDPDKAKYKVFYWPESMERQDLPWDRSGAGLKLLREFLKRADDAPPVIGSRLRVLNFSLPFLMWQRPTNRTVEWFWRVTQAMPNRPEENVWFDWGLAAMLEHWEVIKERTKDKGEQFARDIEEAVIREMGSKNDFRWLVKSFESLVNEEVADSV